MNTTEFAPNLPVPQDDLQTSPERLAINPPSVTEVLGQVAIDSQLEQPTGQEYINAGLDQAEAFANDTSNNRSNEAQQIEAAHEAALHDNEIFDAHTAALQENELFDAHAAALQENQIFDAHVAALQENQILDAHVEALKEDEERTKAQAAAELEHAEPDSADKATDAQTASHDRDTNSLEPASPERLYKEATEALKQAGLTTQIAPNSRIIKDVTGNLIITGDTDAKVITRQPGSIPKLTEYHYDQASGELTVAINRTNVFNGRAMEYQPTEQKDWQTSKEVITLPDAIADRFGFKRAVVAAHSR
jgi:hypothetical protein